MCDREVKLESMYAIQALLECGYHKLVTDAFSCVLDEYDELIKILRQHFARSKALNPDQLHNLQAIKHFLHDLRALLIFHKFKYFSGE